MVHSGHIFQRLNAAHVAGRFTPFRCFSDVLVLPLVLHSVQLAFVAPHAAYSYGNKELFAARAGLLAQR